MSKKRMVRVVKPPVKEHTFKDSPVSNSVSIMDFLSEKLGQMSGRINDLNRTIRRHESRIYDLEVENDILIRMLVWSGAFSGRGPIGKKLFACGKSGRYHPKPGGWGVFKIIFGELLKKYQITDERGNVTGKIMVRRYGMNRETQNDSSKG